jgi:glycosyltransferase involved in cell wall biosynthesis
MLGDNCMKIAQVTPYFYHHIGGVESHVLTLSLKLQKNGHDVTVYTSKHSEIPSSETFQGIKVIRIKQLANIFSTPITPKLKKALVNERYDVVHTHTPPPMTAYYTAKACKRSKTPLVITFHCDLELPKIFGKIATIVYNKTLGRYTFNHAQKIIVHTKTYGATSRAIWKSDPVVIPSAVNPNRFRETLDTKEIINRHNLKDKKTVLFVGRLVYHKGLDYLVDSAKLTGPDVRYIIVGSGDYLDKLRKKVKENKIQNKVIFTGNVSFMDLPRYFAVSDVFVLPSITRLEAFGLVVLEAMASRKPVIVSKIPGVTELVEEGVNGLHVEPMNAQDLAKKINLLLSDEKLRKSMGDAGRKKVESEFNWDTVASQIEEVYKQVIR